MVKGASGKIAWLRFRNNSSAQTRVAPVYCRTSARSGYTGHSASVAHTQVVWCRRCHVPCVRTVIVVASKPVRFARVSYPPDLSNDVRACPVTLSPPYGLRRVTMLLTDSAYRELEGRSNGMLDGLGRFLRWLFRRQAAVPVSDALIPFACDNQVHGNLITLHQDDQPAAEPIDLEPMPTFRWRRHPQLRNQPGTDFSPDIEDLERSARSAGVRGLFLARSGRVDEARAAFAVAAAEESLDLSAIPGFWQLSRSGMLAAVSAYDDVERYRDASALGAQIRVTYRPRSVFAVPVTPTQHRSAARS